MHDGLNRLRMTVEQMERVVRAMEMLAAEQAAGLQDGGCREQQAYLRA